MKKIYLFPFFLIGISAWTQNFVPFKQDQPKRFHAVGNSSDNDYFFFSLQSETLGDTIRFKQYSRITNNTVNVSGTSCEGWGGFEAKIIDTTWLGLYINFLPSAQKLHLTNQMNESLVFDFSIPTGDSMEFFTTTDAHYYIKNNGTFPQTVFTSSDNVKHFVVQKYNDLGQISPSPLNDFVVELGENLGLLTFFDAHKFPAIEKPLELEGQINPTIGHYQLTYDEVFPWHTGDTIEVKGYLPYGNNGGGSVSHRIYVVNDRIETADSVSIFFDINEQIDAYPPGSTAVYNIDYPNPLIFAKGQNVMVEPNHLFENTYEYTFGNVNNCGTRAYAARTGSFEWMCDSCHCAIPYDGFGSYLYNFTYMEGLGMTNSSAIGYGNTYNAGAQLIYANIGGVTCGDYIALGLEEYQMNQPKIIVSKTDLLGRPITNEALQLVIYHYSDGSSEKVFHFPE